MRRRRVRRVVSVLLLAVASVVVLVGAALLLLQTATGGALVRGMVVPRINEQIAGRLEVGTLRLRGLRLELGQVALRDPQGAPVAEVERLEVGVSILPLLRRRMVIHRVVVESPALHLVTDARGSNLARSVKARHPAPPQPQPP